MKRLLTWFRGRLPAAVLALVVMTLMLVLCGPARACGPYGGTPTSSFRYGSHYSHHDYASFYVPVPVATLVTPYSLTATLPLVTVPVYSSTYVAPAAAPLVAPAAPARAVEKVTYADPAPAAERVVERVVEREVAPAAAYAGAVVLDEVLVRHRHHHAFRRDVVFHDRVVVARDRAPHVERVTVKKAGLLRRKTKIRRTADAGDPAEVVAVAAAR